ncbi:MAG: hypothetical protein LBG21_00710 [Campylobacteraceae bacterium]|nr:hypothetical protein [Campylobacteraceae bacterium]
MKSLTLLIFLTSSLFASINHNINTYGNINTQTNQLYEGSIGTSVEASIDHRFFSEEGRDSIKEDFYKTGKMADAISDIIEKDNLEISDFFDHVINLETNYEVSKEFALIEDGKYAKMLNNVDSLT